MLFVISVVREVTTPFETLVKNQLVALRFPVFYVFGFTLGRRAALTLIQDYATLWGSGTGLSAGQTRSVRQYITRVGLRYRFTGNR